MKRLLRKFAVVLTCALLAACGGGGGGGGGPSGTTISGTAAKGPLAAGTVVAYALDTSGAKGAQLGQALTSAAGAFSLNVGGYQGPVLLEASGAYVDEATGAAQTITAGAPLRTALANVQGSLTVAVTPLTELAVRQAEAAGGLTAAAIDAANTLVSGLFGFDVVKTLPVAATTAALTTVTADQVTCTLVLASICQQASDQGTTVAALLNSMASQLAGQALLGWTTLDALDAAGSHFLSGNPLNQTGLSDWSLTALPRIGRSSGVLNVDLGTGGVASEVGGVELTLTLPAGSRLAVDGIGQPQVGVITLDAGLPAGTLQGVGYTAPTGASPGELRLALTAQAAIPAGPLATVRFESLGTALPASGDWTLTKFKAFDGASGALLSGPAATLSVAAP